MLHAPATGAPRMTRLLPFASLLTLSLSACAATPPANVRTGGPLPPQHDPCTADAAHAYVGQVASADVVEQARRAAGAEVARVLHPNEAVTMEYRAGRLNLDVDERNVIVRLRCG
jgi:hypothetical protein